MKKGITLIIMLLLAVGVQAQTAMKWAGKPSELPIILSDGTEIRVGTQIEMHQGSNFDGTYKYAYTSSGGLRDADRDRDPLQQGRRSALCARGVPRAIVPGRYREGIEKWGDKGSTKDEVRDKKQEARDKKAPRDRGFFLWLRVWWWRWCCPREPGAAAAVLVADADGGYDQVARK